jgi:serine/threonine protein kinase
MIETIPSGTVLRGRYRIERVLGSGGFGHVYQAVDLSTNQQYAIKEYLVTGASGQEQLKHEAAVLSQLHHPNLPAFQDAFIERGRYYVVLNYIEGNDLTDIIRIARQRNDIVPIPRIMEWLLAICDAVIFLHSQRPPVIHRDIKPDNIRITPNGVAILVDLGNAKAAADGARTLFFIRHQGTPGYAPPEQYPGGTGTDARSDIYALGGTLYFALTAHEPPSVSTRNQSIQQGKPDLPTLQEVLASNPPEVSPEADAARQFRLGVSRPSKPAPRHSRHLAQLGTLPPDLLKQIDRIIHRAMALKPKDRYQSTADFANDLRKVIAALPPAAQAVPARQPDPHSTQPDLPMLYETLQAAREGGDQDAPQNTASPVACPRCNAPLAPRASYCPHCGTALGGSAPTNAAQPGPRAANLSAEQTMLIQPKAVQASVMHAPQPAQHSIYQPVAGSSTAGQVSAPPFVYNGTGNSTRQGTGARTGSQQSSSSGFHVDAKALIALIIILVALLVIMVLLLTSGHHHLFGSISKGLSSLSALLIVGCGTTTSSRGCRARASPSRAVPSPRPGAPSHHRSAPHRVHPAYRTDPQAGR